MDPIEIASPAAESGACISKGRGAETRARDLEGLFCAKGIGEASKNWKGMGKRGREDNEGREETKQEAHERHDHGLAKGGGKERRGGCTSGEWRRITCGRTTE